MGIMKVLTPKDRGVGTDDLQQVIIEEKKKHYAIWTHYL